MKIKICPKCGSSNDTCFVACKRCQSSLDNAEILQDSAAKEYIEKERLELDTARAERERVLSEKEAAEKAKNDAMRAKWDHLLNPHKEAIAKVKLTNGYNFENYAIKDYLGIVNAEVILGTGLLSEANALISDLLGSQADLFESKFDYARTMATQKMILKALSLESNAIIGINYNYTVLGQNMIGVIVTGTAVYIEPSSNE